MTLQKLLCPVDFSAGSERAMQVAIRIANRSDAELVIAHAWHQGEYSLGDFTFPPRAVEQMIEADERNLAEVFRDAQTLGAKRLRSELLLGEPSHEILELLRNDPSFDLVVMGTRGQTALARLVLGSVAEKVVRHAPCPVLIARATEATAFRNVLVPVDFSDSSREAIALAAQLVEPGGGGITLFHAIDIPIATWSGAPAPGLGREIEPHASKMLAEWAADLAPRIHVPVALDVRIGAAGTQILGVLDDGKFDLVVTGSHGRTGIRRVLLGSVAEKIVRHAPCPVLVARSGTRDAAR